MSAEADASVDMDMTADTTAGMTTDMSAEMSAEMEARADAVAYTHAPSIEAHLYNDYINLETGSHTDIWAQGQAQMDAWVNELQDSIDSAKLDNTATITDTSFLEMGNEGEAETETSTSASLSSMIEQQMDQQLEGQIRTMSEQEIEEQAAIVEMLDADAADAAAEGEDLNLSLLESSSTASTSTSSSSTSDLELQAHIDIHAGLRDAMNTKEGMETITELEQERVREEALQHAEQWLQGHDMIQLETDTETETDTESETETDTEATADTQVDATTKAQTLTAQLQAQEARIWASMSAEQKMHARASMAIDTIIQHTMEIHAMNEAASMILDHLISDGYLHEGMDESEMMEEENGNETDVEETKVEDTRPRPVTLTSCSLSASNHLRAPSSTCTCPPPSIIVHCTTHADITYHTSLQDTIDRMHTLRTLIAEIQGTLDKSKQCMLQVEEHMELLKDGVGHGMHVEHEALVDTLSEAMQQLTSYEKIFYQSVEIQAWTCISKDTSRKLNGVKGTIKGSVVHAC